ncbi:MAG: 4Fe-4S dicluster domain-containing protein, partial [Bacteroidota bacterium]|nr:4Fe-4S dicluster domain-containing protein [Bacteroidota bacterium]
TFVSLVIFTGVFYFVFAWFRELVCIIVCPYGRLQGVMLDKKSVVVTYDHVRGEPRGKMSKKEDTSHLGDCIDCNLCVNVCPTGIDIRNGIQLECINCTACIDACNDVMEKINRPKSLIRYDTVEGVEKGVKWKLSPRAIAYSAVLVLLMSVLTAFIANREDVEAILVRTYGTTYQYQGADKVSNLYNVEFLNKTYSDKAIELKLEDAFGAELMIIGGADFVAPSGESSKGTIMVMIPINAIKSSRFKVPIGVYVDGEKIKTFEAGFVAPVTR